MKIEPYTVPNRRGFATGQAAEYLGVTPKALRQLTDSGDVGARWDLHRKGRLYLREDLDSYIEFRDQVTEGQSNERD